jgi:hypothetical protein
LLDNKGFDLWADEMKESLPEFDVEYIKISYCSGVMTIRA